MVHILCDVILDFQTTNPDKDINFARSILAEFEKLFNLLPGSFQLDDPKSSSMGWAFTKLFLSLELAQKLYENNSREIDNTKGRSRSYKFLNWLNRVFEQKGCNAMLKYADDMKNTSGGSEYASNIVAIFSDEFLWSR